jgi:hypothetical protein
MPGEQEFDFDKVLFSPAPSAPSIHVLDLRGDALLGD